MTFSLDLFDRGFNWNNIYTFLLTQLFWASEASALRTRVEHTVNLSHTSLGHSVTVIFHITAINSEVFWLPLSARRIDDNSLTCSSKNWKKEPHFWSAEFIHHAVTAWRTCVRPLAVSISRHCLMVLLPLCAIWCDYSPLWWRMRCYFLHECRRSQAFPQDRSLIPTFSLWPNWFRCDFKKGSRRSGLPACLPSTYPKFLAQMSVISDGQAADGSSDMLLWASLLSFPTACWFYWDKKHIDILLLHGLSSDVVSLWLKQETGTYFFCFLP